MEVSKLCLTSYLCEDKVFSLILQYLWISVSSGLDPKNGHDLYLFLIGIKPKQGAATTLKILEQQDTGICTKTVKIEVPTDEIGTELEGVYKEFMDNAQVPGFRKGKAPRNIVKMKFGKHLDVEAREKAIESAFKKAAEELHIKPVTTPEFSDPSLKKEEGEGEEAQKETKEKPPINLDEPIIFEAKFEYIPSIELADYKDIRPELPPAEVTEKEIVEQINRFRENNAMFVTIEDRPAMETDHVTIDSKATIDGEPFKEATHKEIHIELGSKRYIAGLEDALIGLKIGDKKEFDLILTEDYPIEEKRGKTAHFSVELKTIREKRLPELDDEFAKDMGNFETLDELKERIREDLERNQEARLKQQKRQAIREELLKRNTFDVPPSMVRARYNYINALHDMELRRIGTSLEAEAKKNEGMLARNEQAALDEVRLSLILDRIAEKESITVDEHDYNAYIGRIASNSGYDPVHYARRIESQGIKSYYEREALEEKVLDYLEDLAEIATSRNEEGNESKVEDDNPSA